MKQNGNERMYSELMAKLGMRFEGEDLSFISNEVSKVMAKYDVEAKCMDITLYETFPECAKIYLVSRKIEGVSKGTLDLYMLRIRQFFEYVRKPIEKVTANDVRLFFYDFQNGRNISNRTLDGVRTALSVFFKWANTEGYIQSNPFVGIKPIKYAKKEREYLNEIEMEMLRSACESKRDKAIIEFMYSTACRVSELTILKMSDVNIVTGEVKLFGKGQKERTVYLNAKAKMTLNAYMVTREDNSEYVFVSERKPHNRLTKSGVENIVRNVGKRSGIERNVYPHLIRHTSSSLALQRGMDITEIQKMLGHVNINTTMIYSKTTQENLKNSHHKYVV